MKKYLAYKSLVEQEQFISNLMYEKNKIDKPIISNDIKENINYILYSYDYKSALNITYFNDGYIYMIQSKIEKIDVDNKIIYLQNSLNLSFNDILNIDSEEFYL